MGDRAIQRCQAKKRTWDTAVIISVIVMTTMASVHGWILPDPLQHRQRVGKPTEGGYGGISFQKGNHNCARMGLKGHPATPTDNEGELESSRSGFAANQAVPASEAERKKLVDALFKGSSSNSINIQQQHDEPQPLLEKIDGFLDKPFFDPYAYDDADDSFFGKIANFVKADYELFEAIFVALFFFLLITITKDLLRAQMAIAGLVPSGKIF